MHRPIFLLLRHNFSSHHRRRLLRAISATFPPTHPSDECRSLLRRRDEGAALMLLPRQGLAVAHPANPLPPSLVAPLKCIYKPTDLQLLAFCRSNYEKHANRLRIREPLPFIRCISNLASSPSLSIWRRKKELGKEGLIAAKELKRLQVNPLRLDRFIKSHVSRLLKSDLVAVLAEFQRQDQVFLCMKLYDVVRKEIWYRPDMFFYRDMLMMLARNKKVDEAKQVWHDLKKEKVLFDQHTFGDIIRAFLDSGLPSEAMYIYEEMRQSPDPPLSLPFRVILKGLIPYEELREKIKHDFLELFPNMTVYDPAEDLFEDEESDSETERWGR